MSTVTKSLVENDGSSYKSTWVVNYTGANITVGSSSTFIFSRPTFNIKYTYSGKNAAYVSIGFNEYVGSTSGYNAGYHQQFSRARGSMTSGTVYTLTSSNGDCTESVSSFFNSSNSTSKTVSIILVCDEARLNSYKANSDGTSSYNNTYLLSSATSWGTVRTITLNAPPTYTATTTSSGPYFKDRSTYKVNLTNLEAKYGGTISSVVLTVGSQTTSRTTNGEMSISLNAAGTFTPSITATDSRGQTTTKTLSEITVIDHQAPTCSYTINSSGPYYVDASTYNITVSNIVTYDNVSIKDAGIKLSYPGWYATRSTAGSFNIILHSTGTYSPTLRITDNLDAYTEYTLSSITVYENTIPTCTATVSSSGYYYAGASRYSVNITNATAYNSKTVSSVKLNVGTQTATISGNGTLNIDVNTAGTFTPTVVITDNIGATNTYTLSSLTVYANTAPTFNAATSSAGNYYAGVTDYSVVVANSTAYNYKTISQVKLTIGNQTVTGTGDGTLTIKCSTDGIFTPVVTVTDNMGVSTTQNMNSLTVRPNTVPSATVTVTSSSPYYEGVASRGYSVSLTNVTAYEEKVITETKLTIGSQSVVGSGNGTLSITLSTIGTYIPVVTIKDNQGAVFTKSLSSIVVNTRSIEASINFLRRTTTSSTLDDEGINAILSVTFNYSKFEGNYLNQPTVKIDGTTTSSITWYTGWTNSGGFTNAVSWNSYQPDSPITLYAKLTSTFATANTYSISITPITTNKTGATVTENLPQAFYLFAGKAGGHSLGIGKKTNTEYLLDIGINTNIDESLTVGKKINQLLTGGSYTLATSSNPYKPVTWSFNKGITPSEGDMVVIQTPSSGHTNGVFLSVDAGSNYYPIAHYEHESLLNHYSINSTIHLIFDDDWSVNNIYPIAGAASRTTITGGAWRVVNGCSKGLVDLFYPVGSYYETSNTSFDPGTTWGGVWESETQGSVKRFHRTA